MMVIKYKAARSDVRNAYWGSWRKSTRFYIFAMSGNSFTIPDRAFASGSQRAEFLRQATGRWEEARRPAREAVS